MTISEEYPERESRLPVFEHCTVARDNGELAAGMLLNLSEHGFCVESRHRLEVGEKVELRVKGLGRFSGIVRWTRGNRVGAILDPFGRAGSD